MGTQVPTSPSPSTATINLFFLATTSIQARQIARAQEPNPSAPVAKIHPLNCLDSILETHGLTRNSPLETAPLILKIINIVEKTGYLREKTFLPWEPYFEKRIDQINGITLNDVTNPVMWGISPIGRIYFTFKYIFKQTDSQMEVDPDVITIFQSNLSDFETVDQSGPLQFRFTPYNGGEYLLPQLQKFLRGDLIYHNRIEPSTEGQWTKVVYQCCLSNK